MTGIRGSLQRNLDIKRTSPGVVDVISAEDIGKFPDSNVASAMQRLPGVSIQRSGSRGEATGVSIRGFGGDFNDTLYDGRRVSTASGGRGVDFTTVGADFVGRLSVYKTPDVGLSSSAIGATIDVAQPKPFDRTGFHASAVASGTIQSRNKDARPSAGILLSDTFADDTFGVLGNFIYSRRDTTSNQVFIPGWVGNRFYRCQSGPSCSASDLTAANKTVLGWFPQQIGANQVTTQDERIDGRLAVQWRPSDTLLLTVDHNYTRQTLHTETYGYGAWFAGDDLRNLKLDSNGTAIDFNQFGTPMDFNAGFGRSINQTNQTGANVKWEATDRLKFDVDGAYAKSVFNPHRNGYGDNMDIGYGGYNNSSTGPFLSTGGRVSTILGANTGLGIIGSSSNDLPVLHDIGPAGNLSRFLDTSVMGSHVIVRGAPYRTNKLKQGRFTGSYDGDNFKIAFGGQYLDTKFYQESTNTFTNNVFASYGGYGTPSGRTGALYPLPAAAFKGTISTNGFIPGYSSSGLAPGFLKYDPYVIYSALEATGRGSVSPAFDPGSVLSVHEKTYAIFVKAGFDVEIGDMPFHFNAGIRNEGTKVTASAIGRDPTQLILDANDPTLLQAAYTPTQSIVRGNKYNYLLPSLDMKLEITPKLYLRADASRTLTRPVLGDLKPTVNLGTLRRGSLSASGGNPNLTPYLADNYDLGVEWYYARNSYFAVNGFIKNLSNFIVGGVSTQTFPGVIDPFTGSAAQFQVNAKINGPKATVRGVEIAMQQVFGDSGFGFSVNGTFVNTNRKFDSADISGAAFAITGLANSANFVGFYDKNGFQIRASVNWRDEYLSGLGQGQGGTFGAEPVYVDKQIQVDMSASYDITPQLTVFGEATNLNNSTYSTHGRFSNQTLDVWSYGRRFTAGARFHF
ncbi:TonB-dependent receptor [Sphingomonas sp.]|uniref:TonB-dependent receptor n=1 Tax=Sphingomonas sp. TaxID=28214 RepID=UPI00345B4F63